VNLKMVFLFISSFGTRIRVYNLAMACG
jgi:hypothetical protein